MPISLAEVKRGYKVRRKDEEEINSPTPQQTITTNQTINLKDIRDGKTTIKPITNNGNNIDKKNDRNKLIVGKDVSETNDKQKKEKNNQMKKNNVKTMLYDSNNQQRKPQIGDKTLLKNDITHYKEPLQKEDTVRLEYKSNNKKNKKKSEENLFATINNGLIQLAKGPLDFTESVIDAGLQLGSSKYNPFMYLFGDKDTIERRQQIAQEVISDSAKNRALDKLGYNKKLSNGKTVQEELDSKSLIKSDNFSGQLMEGIGNMLPAILTGNVGAGTVGASGLMGLNSYGSAIDEAYNEGANRKEANLYGLGSAAVETATEYLTSGIPGVSKISNVGLDNIAEAGLGKISNKIARETARIGYKAAGEGLEEGITEAINPLLKNATYSEGEKIDWNQVKDAFVMGAATGLVLDGPANFYNMNQAIKEQVNSKRNSESKNVQNIFMNEKTLNPVQNNVSLNNASNIINNQIDNLNLKQSAQSYNIDINNETIQNIDKTLSNRGIISRFDASKFTNNNENAFWQLNKDGSREVVFNPKAKTNDLLENVAVHELYHDISNSKNGQKIKDELLDFAKTKEGYNEARKSLEQLYSNKYDPNSDKFNAFIDEEAVASILGKKLGNQEFVNSLTVEKPSVAKSVYNWVVDKLNKLNKLTGYKSEKLFWKDVKNKFDSAYRSEFNKNNVDVLDNDMFFSKGKLTSGEDVVVSDDINGSRPSNKMAEKTLKKMLGITYVNNSNNNEIIISNKDIKKYLNDGYNNYRNAKLKKRIAGNYGEVIELAKINSSEPNYKNSKRGKQGYDYYDVNLAYPIKDSYGNVMDYKYYTARLVVRKDNNSNFAYDLDKFTEKKGAALDKTSLSITTGKPVSSSFSGNNIPNSNQNVKSGISTKYSMQIGEKNTKELDNKELDNSSFSFDKNKTLTLEDRVSGNELLDAQDLIQELKDVNAEVDKNGYVTVYHQTSEENAKKIQQSGKMISKERDVFFSTSKEAQQASGRGQVKLKFKIPVEKLLLDDIFSDNADVKIHLNGKESLDVSNYLVSDDSQSTKYSLFNTDNQGRTLSKGQQEFFKDSKVRNNNGNLITYYNGSDNFNVYDKNKLSNNSKWGKGIYLTKYKDIASMYGNNIKELYVNIKNPISSTKKTISFDEYNELYKKINDGESGYIEEYSMYDNDLDLLWDMTNSGNWADYAKEIREITGKDGLIINDDNKAEDMVIAFESNQLKSVDNLNPTNTEDIRYSQSNNKWQNFVDKNFKNEGTGHTLSQVKTNQTLNPTEIANLTKEDASTTPKLPNVPVQKGDKQSKFTKNIAEKTKMLTEENRMKLSTEDDISYYKGITNKQSLDEAYSRLNDGGSGETLNWISRNSYDKDGKLKKKPTATDVAEGWILLKQYQDAGDYDSMVQVAKVMRQMGTESGQAIQAYNIMSRLTPEGMVKYAQSELDEAYDHMVKNKTKQWIEKNRDKFTLTPDETAYIVNNIKEASELPDGYEKKVKLAQIQSLISNKLPPTRGAGIKAWMRISMLFNAKTQIRNIMGNAVITPVNAISDTFSALMDKQIAKKTGVRTTGAPNVKNFAKGFKKGLYESWNDFKLDINTRNMQGNRFEIGEGKSFTDKTKVGRALNRTDKILSFMLDAGDRPFYEATFINSINNQKILNNTDKVTQDMIDIATTEALQKTWQDNNAYTKFVLNTRRGLNFGMKYGLGDVLIPFAKTPANLTKALIDYSPAGLVTTLIDGQKLKNAIETNQFTPQMQHKFVQNLGKATAGSLLYIIGYILAKEGITTGANDEDKDVSDFMRNTLGIQPYSIKIGNKTFTYDWAQPVATPFAMMADLQKKDEEAGILNKILSTADVGANLLLQQSFMESIENVFSDYQSIPNGIIQQVLDLPSRAVPTLVKQVNDMIDTTQRTSFEKSDNLKTAKNKVKSKIPVLSTGLAPSRDSLGRVIKKYGGDANLFNVFLNPANTNKGKVSDSAKEIYKIYQKTGDKTIMPRVAPYSIVSGGKSKTLDSKERSEFQKISGQIVEKNIKELAKTDEYRKMDDSYKTEAIKSIVDYAYNYAKAKSLKQPISKNYKKAYEYTKNGGALYDFYADKIYKKSKEK